MTKEQQKQKIIDEMEHIVEIFESMGVPTCLSFYIELLKNLQNHDPELTAPLRLKVPQPPHWPQPHENAAGYVRTLNNFFIASGISALCTIDSEFVPEDGSIVCYAIVAFRNCMSSLESMVEEVDTIHST